MTGTYELGERFFDQDDASEIIVRDAGNLTQRAHRGRRDAFEREQVHRKDAVG